MPLLGGCVSKPPVEVRTVTVTRDRIVGVPVELTAPTPGPDVPNRPLFGDDLERGWTACTLALASCNGDKAATREFSRKAAEPKR